MSARKPLDYTFGNHMHWVDMQWLWGYQVLPDSIRDMLKLCAETGAKGNVNFDGVGYEKLASEDPTALAELRAAVQAGTIEVVGASYGQPYGLFHGGESNVRQRVYGVRTATRLLGARPRAFWEEEFDFYPQLPQLLAGCGFRAASLFFQWTWHTPHIPKEETTLIQWEGVDGTRLPTLARTDLCLHQWPEDFDGLLDSPEVLQAARPALVQWLELMPSPDWMCRSEVLLPRLKELFADPRFELRPRTLSELVAAHDDGDAPVRAYGMDDVFHGMSLGKNGDHMPRLSARVEETLLAAESFSCVAGLVGRPYPSWDVYPSWELEEAWRELLAAQHHDNHECEGLCGSVGERSFERASGLGGDVLDRTLDRLAARVDAPVGSMLAFNPCGWARDIAVSDRIARDVPAFGWAPAEEEQPYVECEEREDELVLPGPNGDFTICARTGRLLGFGAPMGDLRLRVDGEEAGFPEVEVYHELGHVVVLRSGPMGIVEIEYALDPLGEGISMDVKVNLNVPPDGGVHSGLTLEFPTPPGAERIIADTPYALGEVRAQGEFQRKYPSGDWMTSEQWFETVRGSFTSLTLVDLCGPENGLLILHDGSQAWLRTETGVRCVLTLYDPWDEDHFERQVEARFHLVPHQGLTHAERWRRGREHVQGALAEDVLERGGDLPARLAPLELEGSEGVVVSAFYREHRKAAEHLPDYFSSEVRNPFVVRLVELNGQPGRVRLMPPGPVARAARTNLMGEVIEELDELVLDLRPHEVATVMLDLEAGRHQPRDLDQHRSVWATVHKSG